MTRRAKTTYVVWHCSATRPSVDIGVKEIRAWHVDGNGWPDIGYAAVIRRDGTIEFGRHFDEEGAHVAGYNAISVGICLVGGLDHDGKPFDNRPDLYTAAQWASVRRLYAVMRACYPFAQHVGHRDLSPDRDADGVVERHEWLKTCPGFHVAQEIVKL